MAGTTSSPPLRHPERIHPALWRGSQLARSYHSTIATGFTALDQHLPGQGWPLSTLIELMPAQPGMGEIHLLQSALARLETQRSIALVNPPYVPYFHCWINWQLARQRLLWVKPPTLADTLWATEQILKHNACSAVLCWASQIRLASLRRLHQAAQQSESLLIVVRPQTAAHQASAAPLRLCLDAIPQGIKATIIKRRGPTVSHPISLMLYPHHAAPTDIVYDAPSLDQHLSDTSTSHSMFVSQAS